MTGCDDVGRLLEAASHALASASERGHSDGVTGGPAAMLLAPGTQYGADVGVTGGVHVDPVDSSESTAG